MGHRALVEDWVCLLRPAWGAHALAVMVLGCASLAPWLSSLPWWAVLVVDAVLIMGAYPQLRCALLLDCPGSVVSLRSLADGRWLVRQRDGREVTGRFIEAVRQRLWLVLAIRLDDGGVRRVWITAGMLDTEGMRRLRVRLLLAASVPAPDTDDAARQPAQTDR